MADKNGEPPNTSTSFFFFLRRSKQIWMYFPVN